MTKQGKVYLIGAGPGDPGLLSIKAMECLKAADAVVYDRLADPRILSYARPDAEMVYVGKASANHTMRQPDINKLLVKLAAEGKTVARLKGGDPFVFGRGGEEAIELLEAGLPFEFVPGVTSAIAVAEYACNQCHCRCRIRRHPRNAQTCGNQLCRYHRARRPHQRRKHH